MVKNQLGYTSSCVRLRFGDPLSFLKSSLMLPFCVCLLLGCLVCAFHQPQPNQQMASGIFRLHQPHQPASLVPFTSEPTNGIRLHQPATWLPSEKTDMVKSQAHRGHPAFRLHQPTAVHLGRLPPAAPQQATLAGARAHALGARLARGSAAGSVGRGSIAFWDGGGPSPSNSLSCRFLFWLGGLP